METNAVYKLPEAARKIWARMIVEYVQKQQAEMAEQPTQQEKKE